MQSSLIKNSLLKPFPNFIKNSKIISSDVSFDKIFPQIDLPNASSKLTTTLDFSEIAVDKIIHLAIRKWINDVESTNCETFITDFKSLQLLKISHILYILKEISRRITSKVGISNKNEEMYLTTPISSYDGKVLIKSKTNVLALVKDLLKHGELFSKVELLDIKEIKKECKNLKIVFSASGIDGAWDIATMSMRGIKSCMRWEADQCKALVGSITDPCCGIIYITNGKETTYGSKTLFRAVVRLVVKPSVSNEPILLIDNLYSSFYKTKPGEYNKLDFQVLKLFENYINEQTQGKMKIIHSYNSKNDLFNYIIPLPDNFNLISDYEISYRDSRIPYSHLYPYKSYSKNIIEKYNQAPVVKKKSIRPKTVKKLTKKPTSRG